MSEIQYKGVKDVEQTEELLADETEEQYQERVVVQCLNELFLRIQMPRSLIDGVWEIVERHGVWAALAATKLVVDAFEAGKRCSSLK